MCNEDPYYDDYSNGHDAGYQSGYDDGYQSGRDSRGWEIDDLYEDVARLERFVEKDVARLERFVENPKAALVDAGVHSNLVEAIANG